MDQKYLLKHYNTWIAVLEVPKPLRARAGRARFRKSLKTHSLAEANRRKHGVIAEWQRQLATLAAESGGQDAEMLRSAVEWHKALKASKDRWIEDSQGREVNERHETLSDIKDEAKTIEDWHGPEAARRFYKAATGQATFLKDHYPTWLGEVEHAEQTKVQHTATIKRFMKWSHENVTIEETNRRKAGEYVGYLLKSSGLSRKTIKRHVSSLSSLWRWLKARGLASENPWLDQELGKKASTFQRKGLDDEALLKLLNGSYSTPRFRQVLHDLLRLGLLTGARLEELCALKCADVTKREDGYWLSITDGKTEAAVREIPVHELAVPIIERRLKDKDEYLFKGLEAGGPDEKRMWYVSKAYGRFRNHVGVDQRGQDFHALRNTFISMMEGAGAPESTVKLLVGHKRSSMTYGHYSKGERVELRKVIEMLDYSKEVQSSI